MSDTDRRVPVECAFEDFINQHPASVRLVRWQRPSQDTPRPGGRDPAPGGHLEIESKHGQVAVIDHRSGAVYRHPPRPPDTDPSEVRSWSDLTARLPGAFNDRPRFSRIAPRYGHQGILIAWRFELNTGSVFEFHMHPDHPVLSTDP